jgi:hypothetical protein
MPLTLIGHVVFWLSMVLSISLFYKVIWRESPDDHSLGCGHVVAWCGHVVVVSGVAGLVSVAACSGRLLRHLPAVPVPVQEGGMTPQTGKLADLGPHSVCKKYIVVGCPQC